MKTQIKKYAGALLAGTIVIGGIASAAITPIPTISNTFAVAGQVIKSADLNKLAEALNILDARTKGGNLTSSTITAVTLPWSTNVEIATISVDKTGWYEVEASSLTGDYPSSGQTGWTQIVISSTPGTMTEIPPSNRKAASIMSGITSSHCFFGEQKVYLTAGQNYYVFALQQSASRNSATLRAGAKIYGTYLGE